MKLRLPHIGDIWKYKNIKPEKVIKINKYNIVTVYNNQYEIYTAKHCWYNDLCGCIEYIKEII
jgi:hypothetical protein